MLDELDQHAAGAARVDERYAVALGARARGVVDQVEATAREVGEGGLDVVDAVGDVVETGAAPGEESCHRVIGGERLDELDLRCAGADEADGHALGRDRLDWGRGGAGQGFEGRERRADRLDRHGNMVEGETLQGIMRKHADLSRLTNCVG